MFAELSEMLLFAHMGKGEVTMVSKSHTPGDNNMALIGRSSRPVAVAYDPLTQVYSNCITGSME